MFFWELTVGPGGPGACGGRLAAPGQLHACGAVEDPGTQAGGLDLGLLLAQSQGHSSTSLLGHLVWQPTQQPAARPAFLSRCPLAASCWGVSGSARTPPHQAPLLLPWHAQPCPGALSSPWGVSAPHSQVEVFKASPGDDTHPLAPLPQRSAAANGAHMDLPQGAACQECGGSLQAWGQLEGTMLGPQGSRASWKHWGTSSEWAGPLAARCQEVVLGWRRRQRGWTEAGCGVSCPVCLNGPG